MAKRLHEIAEVEADPLEPLLRELEVLAGLPPDDRPGRLRALLATALGELADSNRRLRELSHQREGLMMAAAGELRASAGRLADPGAGPGEAARLRRMADDLAHSFRPGAEARPRPQQAARPAGAGPRVLVADDEPDAREALRSALEPAYDVLEASDGEEAVELAREGHPDIALLDLFMPRLDGLGALERLRADPATAEIPVLFVSGQADEATRVRSFDLGAVDYLQKPFSAPELRARVERTLRIVSSQSALRALAQTDALTGLANLRAFRIRVAEEVKRAHRYHTPLTCVMADMDALKSINDGLGHAAGDRAIAAVASVIGEELRETDLGARYGGDEFVLLLPHTTAEEGRVLAERVCGRLAEMAQDPAWQLPVGASFGVACLPPEDGVESAEALVRAADRALYAAKSTGRGRVAVAPPWPAGHELLP